MGETTGIGWCDSTFNPWIGCTEVSAACDFCYARTLVHRWGLAQWGDHPRHRTSKDNWKTPLTWQRRADKFQAEHGRRRRVFCASLADVFDNQVDPQWRADLWSLIASTPAIDWLLLTKRPQNIAKMLPAHWSAGWPNVWLGTTAENQEEADRRIPALLKAPAVVHFVSCEPLLGPVWVDRNVDWVIVGGESGAKARPMAPRWARLIRDQCRDDGIPFFMKQWGEWAPPEQVPQENWSHHHYHVDDEHVMRVGTKRSGRRLDGVEHSGFPEVR
jgi:protein gp37